MSSFKDKVNQSSLGSSQVRAARSTVSRTHTASVIARSNAVRSSASGRFSTERGGK